MGPASDMRGHGTFNFSLERLAFHFILVQLSHLHLPNRRRRKEYLGDTQHRHWASEGMG